MMIESVLKCEDFCRECAKHGNKELFLPDEDWLGLKCIQETLLPSFIGTKKLQTRELTLPDVRKIIHIAHTKTAELGNCHWQ